MSNCVEIHTEFVLTSDYFNVDKFLDDMASHDYVNDKGFKRFFAPEATNAEFYFYWFIGPKSFYLENHDLVVSLGDHRSGHTWRDLTGLENFLSQYTRGLKPDEAIRCPCRMSDESDGFSSEYDGEFVIGVAK